MSNCGQDFQKELTTQFFQNEVKNILLAVRPSPSPSLSLSLSLSSRSHTITHALTLAHTQSHSDPRVTHRLKELLLSWSSEFKSASHMKYGHTCIIHIMSLYISISAVYLSMYMYTCRLYCIVQMVCVCVCVCELVWILKPSHFETICIS